MNVKFIKLITLLISIVLFNISLQAKNWTWYIYSTNVIAGSPGHFDLTIGVRANSVSDVGKLGHFVIRGTMSSELYDFGEGHDPIMQTNHLTNYTMTVTDGTVASQDWQSNCTYEGASGSGADVTVGGIAVTTIRFYIETTTGSALITLGSLQQTLEDNNTTPVTVSYDNSGGDPALPVELSSFNAKAKGSNVELKWQTATELNNYGFEVERKANDEESASWGKVGFVSANGNSNSPKDYSYTDKNITGGPKFVYRLKQIDNNGTFKYSDNVEVEVVPDKFELCQNYPNPFNPVTNIKFSLPEAGKIKLDIYNIIGQHITTLVDQNMEAGFYNIPFDAANLATGTYIYRITAQNFSQTKKMLLIK